MTMFGMASLIDITLPYAATVSLTVPDRHGALQALHRGGSCAGPPGRLAHAQPMSQHRLDPLDLLVGHGRAAEPLRLPNPVDPARMRSRIIARSNSAKTEIIPNNIRPLGVLVSSPWTCR